MSVVDDVVRLLESNGYRQLKQPVSVSGLPFEFAATLTGVGSLDLVVIVDTAVEADEEQLRRKIIGLARALDLTESRRILTLVLAGPSHSLELASALARAGRVLTVGQSGTGISDDRALEALAVLLPLSLPRDDQEVFDSWGTARTALEARHSGSAARAVFAAAADGTEAVRGELARILGRALEGPEK